MWVPKVSMAPTLYPESLRWSVAFALGVGLSHAVVGHQEEQ